MMSKIDVDKQIETLRRGDKLNEADVKALCLQAKEILTEESNVIKL